MGNVGDHIVGDVGVVRICGDVNDWSRAADFDHRASRAHCQCQVNRGKVTDFNDDAFALQLGESCGLHH